MVVHQEPLELEGADRTVEVDVVGGPELVGIAGGLLDQPRGDVGLPDGPTRGGLASTLHEMASKSGVGVLLDESAVPRSDAVRSAGELLGIDPFHVANEGKVVLAVRPGRAEEVLEA
ncbi:MAG: hydrogenase expression/formation protein HypE, partial [Phycisphaeraceae bacterium]|nr:hydrogenase expression/formation protein HypE [Phycisphaeraceae bacterium]